MALTNTHLAGDKIKAEDMNDTVDAILQANHNIFELALQNYFASLSTPVTGLIFDGFSDTAKADIASTTLAAQAASGQANLLVSSSTGFAANKSISIFDGINLEEGIVQSTSVSDGFINDISNTGTNSFNLGAINSGTPRWIAQSFQPTQTGIASKATFRLDGFGSSITIRVLCEIRTDNAGAPSSTVLATSSYIRIDGNDPAADRTFDFAGTVTLNAGTTYWFVLKHHNADNAVDVYGSSTSNYANGAGAYSDNSGSSWTAGFPNAASGDAYFIYNMAVGEALDQSQTTSEANQIANFQSSFTSWQAQSFVPATSGNIRAVSVSARANSPQYGMSLNCSIYSDSGNQPSAQIGQAMVSKQNAPDVKGEWRFHVDASGSQIPVTAGTKYWLVVKLASHSSGTDNVDLFGDSSGNPYTSGQCKFTTNSGGSWSDGGLSAGGANADLWFKTFLSADTITLTSNLTNTYASGSAVRRTGVEFETTNKRILIEDGVFSSVASDNFNRADSNTVGGGWDEFGFNATAERILSNRLRITRDAGGSSSTLFGVRRDIGANRGIGLSTHIIYNPQNNSGFGDENVRVYPYFGRNDNLGNGLGIEINRGQNPDAWAVQLDGSNQSTFTQDVALTTDHNIWIDIVAGDAANQVKVKVYLNSAGSTKPASPLHTSPNITLNATQLQGTYAKIFLSASGTFDVDFDDYTADFSGVKTAHYYMRRNVFQSAMNLAKLWVVRNFPSRFNLYAAIAQSATTLQINGDKRAHFAVNDTIDVWNSTNEVRERKTVSAVGGELIQSTHSVDFERSSQQYGSIADAAQTGLDLAGNFTIEGWLKLESDPASGEIFGICGKGTSPSNVQYAIDYTNSGGSTRQFRLFVSDNGSTINSGTVNYTLPVGVWTHFAVVYDNVADSMELFINGVSQGTGAVGATGALFNSAQPFVLGVQLFNETARAFDGRMDNVRVWSVKRTGTEILNNYNNNNVANNATNLVAYWRLDNNFTDSNPNANHLTNNNSTTFSTDVPENVAQTQLTFSPAVVVAGGFGTTAFVERVDLLPKISIVDGAANESLQTMTFNRSIVDFTNSEVEDEYQYTPSPAETDVTVKLTLSRNSVEAVPYAKRLGVTLHD